MNTRSLLAVGVILTLLAGAPHALAVDTDADGVDDSQDNCSQIANPVQRDSNGDGFGNRCDPDLNGDLIVNANDLGIIKALFFGADEDADFSGDGTVNFIDLGIMKAFFFSPPGPGAVPPAITYSNDVQPIFGAKCAPCHTGLGVGGNNIGTDYTDALNPAGNSNCSGLNVGQCSLVLIQLGEMPQGAGCTGDPAQDAGNAACLTQLEQDTVQIWIDLGLPE